MENKTNLILPGAILIAALLISGSIVFYSLTVREGGGLPVKEDEDAIVDVSIDDDPILGNPKAKITLVEFSDFQCPFCRSFWQGAFQDIKKEYIDTGKARLVFRDYPLSFHPAAIPSAEAAQCADEQGKFWEMHDKLFEEQAKLGQNTIQYTEQNIKDWAGKIPGLDMVKWSECFTSGKYKNEIQKDIADGNKYGVSGTPTLFVNGKPVVGAQPFQVFKAEMDKILQ